MYSLLPITQDLCISTYSISVGRLLNIVTFLFIAAHFIVARIGNRNISIILAFHLRTEFKAYYAQKSSACSAECDLCL